MFRRANRRIVGVPIFRSFSTISQLVYGRDFNLKGSEEPIRPRSSIWIVGSVSFIQEFFQTLHNLYFLHLLRQILQFSRSPSTDLCILIPPAYMCGYKCNKMDGECGGRVCLCVAASIHSTAPPQVNKTKSLVILPDMRFSCFSTLRRRRGFFAGKISIKQKIYTSRTHRGI